MLSLLVTGIVGTDRRIAIEKAKLASLPFPDAVGVLLRHCDVQPTSTDSMYRVEVQDAVLSSWSNLDSFEALKDLSVIRVSLRSPQSSDEEEECISSERLEELGALLISAAQQPDVKLSTIVHRWRQGATPSVTNWKIARERANVYDPPPPAETTTAAIARLESDRDELATKLGEALTQLSALKQAADEKEEPSAVNQEPEATADPTPNAVQASGPIAPPSKYALLSPFGRPKESTPPEQLRINCYFPDPESHKRINRIVTITQPVRLADLDNAVRAAFRRADLSVGCIADDGFRAQVFVGDKQLRLFLEDQKSERLPVVIVFSRLSLQRVEERIADVRPRTPSPDIIPDVNDPSVRGKDGAASNESQRKAGPKKAAPPLRPTSAASSATWRGSRTFMWTSKSKPTIDARTFRKQFEALAGGSDHLSRSALEAHIQLDDMGESDRAQRIIRSVIGNGERVSFDEFSIILLKAAAC